MPWFLVSPSERQANYDICLCCRPTQEEEDITFSLVANQSDQHEVNTDEILEPYNTESASIVQLPVPRKIQSISNSDRVGLDSSASCSVPPVWDSSEHAPVDLKKSSSKVERTGSPSTSTATVHSDQTVSLVESEKNSSPTQKGDVGAATPTGAPDSPLLSPKSDDSQPAIRSSLEPALTLDDRGPWNETPAPAVSKSQISSKRDGNMALEDVVEIEHDLFQISNLREEAESYYSDERLLRAWVTAETCLRMATRYAESVECEFPTHEGKQYSEKFHSFVHDLTMSTSYIGISTKVRLLLDLFSLFELEDRFDLSSLGHEGSFSVGTQRGRMASKESAVSDFTLSSGDIGDWGQKEVGEKSKKGFFRLGSKGRRKKKERKDSKESFSQSPRGLVTSGELHPTTKKHRFMRRQKHPESNQGVAVSNSPSMVGGLENEKGLQLSHKVNSNGSISVRIKVKMRIPLFQVLAILNETDFYDKWVPYCKKCNNIGQETRASMLLQQIADYPWPIKQKETISFCFGVDALDEFGCVVISSYGLAEDVSNFLSFKIPAPQRKCPRVPSSNFLFLLFPVDEGKATIVELFANVDPGITTLRSVILPVIKIVVIRSVKGFFHKIGVLATHFTSSGYEDKVQQNPEIYDWIRRRIAEGAELGRFRKGSSVQTLIFDDLKDTDKK